MGLDKTDAIKLVPSFDDLCDAVPVKIYDEPEAAFVPEIWGGVDLYFERSV